MTPTQKTIWAAFDYEVRMFNYFYELVIVNAHYGEPADEKRWAYTECLVLHSRILCEIVVGSSFSDNIDVPKLVPGFQITDHAKFDAAYGNNKPGTTRYEFNKRLAHPTTVRGESYDYTAHVKKMEPLLRQAIAEINIRRPA